MHNTPWVDKKSILDITSQSRGTAGLSPLDMGFLYFFKNGESKHCLDDSEAYDFYAKNKDRLDTE